MPGKWSRALRLACRAHPFQAYRYAIGRRTPCLVQRRRYVRYGSLKAVVTEHRGRSPVTSSADMASVSEQGFCSTVHPTYGHRIDNPGAAPNTRCSSRKPRTLGLPRWCPPGSSHPRPRTWQLPAAVVLGGCPRRRLRSSSLSIGKSWRLQLQSNGQALERQRGAVRSQPTAWTSALLRCAVRMEAGSKSGSCAKVQGQHTQRWCSRSTLPGTTPRPNRRKRSQCQPRIATTSYLVCVCMDSSDLCTLALRGQSARGKRTEAHNQI